MSKILNSLVFIPFLYLVSPVAGASSTDDLSTPFEARYEVLIDGKPRLETVISLSEADGAWRFRSTSKGMRGLARLLNTDSLEASTGQWEDGSFRPEEFVHRSKVAGRDDEWSAHFDWEGGAVTTRHADGESVLPLSPATNDPMSATLAIRLGLSQGARKINLSVLDEDEVDQHVYEARDAGDLDTPLGCFAVVEVRRIREGTSKRYSSGWYAESLDWIPVQMRHGKRGGKEFLMRLNRLERHGQEIPDHPACTP